MHITASERDLTSFLKSTKRGMQGRKGDAWALENSMRTEIIRRFKRAESSYLKDMVMQNLPRTFAIQSDADEIMSLNALMHVKLCELKPGVKYIYAPSLVFKKNFYWMERTEDMKCIVSFEQDLILSHLIPHLWRPGPYIMPIVYMLDAGSTLRKHNYDINRSECKYHLGLKLHNSIVFCFHFLTIFFSMKDLEQLCT